MATKIKSVRNESEFPIAYVGTGASLTGWVAYGFGPKATDNLDWKVETNEGNQALLTKAGTFFIWDAGGWEIKVKHGDDPATTLVKVTGMFPEIELIVNDKGLPSAKQIGKTMAASQTE